jgi:hypothetical protein
MTQFSCLTLCSVCVSVHAARLADSSPPPPPLVSAVNHSQCPLGADRLPGGSGFSSSARGRSDSQSEGGTNCQRHGIRKNVFWGIRNGTLGYTGFDRVVWGISAGNASSGV